MQFGAAGLHIVGVGVRCPQRRRVGWTKKSAEQRDVSRKLAGRVADVASPPRSRRAASKGARP